MDKADILKADILKEAERYCEEHGFRYTDPRRDVLATVAASERPCGAYDILERMGEGADKKPKATTVYRAIEFWQQHGFVHKIESLNAFVTCHAGHNHAGSQFTVCEGCGGVKEIHLCHLPPDLQKIIERSGFMMQRWNTEIHGLCHQCRP